MGDEEVHTFPNGHLSKSERNSANRVELAYYDITAQHVSHYVTRTLFKACIYNISFNNCNKVYVGETFKTINKRIYAHKRDFKFRNFLNALSKGNLETNCNFKDSKIFARIHNNQYRNIVEINIISNYNKIKQKPGSFDRISYG